MLRTEAERSLAAMRHRLDRNTFRFLCETHRELPRKPPQACRTLVLFAHFDPEGVIDPHVVYYLKALHGLGAAIIFVSGSPTLTPESVAPIRSLCAGIYTRRTLSHDFGSWHLAWWILRQRGWSLDEFDRFVVANDSVFGPLFPIEEMWGSFHEADMYGAIENSQMVPHLQSFLLAWDLNVHTRPFLNNFWDDFRYVVHKGTVIMRYEVGLSRRARQAGLTVKPFVSAASIEAAYGSQAHPWLGRLVGQNNGTLYHWDNLIEDFRFPFLKTVLARQADRWHVSIPHLRGVIEQRTSYPYRLIESNVERLRISQSAAHERPVPGGQRPR
jgi:lipopolysaccharide biosynthesis protein